MPELRRGKLLYTVFFFKACYDFIYDPVGLLYCRVSFSESKLVGRNETGLGRSYFSSVAIFQKTSM
jgi:hypothetical protein